MFELVGEYLDKPLLRYHAEIRKWWESKGKSVDFLAFSLNISGFAAHLYLLSSPLVFGGTISTFAAGANIAHKTQYNMQSNVRVKRHTELASMVRLPTFLYGSGYGSYAIYRLFTHPDMDVIYCLGEGLASIMIASSIYLKDADDPKSFDKSPSKIKAALEKLGKLKIPIPRPITSPGTAFQPLEQELYLI